MSEIINKGWKFESFFHSISNQIPVVVWITDENGACNYLNKKWFEYTDQKQGTALGYGWLNAIHPEEKAQIKQDFLEANRNQSSFRLEYRLRGKEGEYRWHMDAGEPRFDEKGRFEGYIGVVIDIHDRKKAEDSLRESELHYKTFAEAMPQMAFIADPKGDIIYYNKRWYEYIKSLKDTEGWGWRDRLVHHPDDLQRTVDRWNHSLKTGEPYEIEYRLRRYDGKYRWHLGRAMPLYNKQGKITLWLGTNTDIHEQKTAEKKLQQINSDLQNKNRRLEQLRKLRESLLHIIAHDLKGPLGNMELALNLLNSASEANRQKLMEGLHGLVFRQKKVIDGLSEIIHVQNPHDVRAKNLLLREIINEVFQDPDIQPFSEALELHLNEAPAIKYAESFLFSILKNLISNAVKYRSPHRPLLIRIESKREDQFVLITVKDNGTGIDLERYANDIFQPFNRFTDEIPGNGIGLYIVKNLVEGNGGAVKIESRPNEGATFFCYLKEND